MVARQGALSAEVGQLRSSLAPRRLFGLPLPIALLILCLFIPQEASFFIFDQRWTISRLVLALLSPYIMVRYMIVLMEKPRGICMADLVLLFPGAWMFVASYYSSDPRWLPFAGSNALEFCVPYAAARVLLREEEQIIPAVRLLAYCLAIFGALAVLDNIFQRAVIKDLISSVTGVAPPWFYEYRQGILRAYSVYEHPILLGCASVVGVILTWYSVQRYRWLTLFGNFIGVILSASSTPLGALTVTAGIIIYAQLTRLIRLRG